MSQLPSSLSADTRGSLLHGLLGSLGDSLCRLGGRSLGLNCLLLLGLLCLLSLLCLANTESKIETKRARIPHSLRALSLAHLGLLVAKFLQLLLRDTLTIKGCNRSATYNNGTLELLNAASSLLGGLLSKTLLVLAAVQNRPGDLARVLALVEERL